MLKLLLGKPQVKIENIDGTQYQTVTIKQGLFNTTSHTRLNARTQNLISIINKAL